LQKDERVGAPLETTDEGRLAVAFVAVAVIGILALLVTVPLDPLATPTLLCGAEIAVVSAIFIVYVAVKRHAKSTPDSNVASLSKPVLLKVEVPRPARILALALFVFGLFFFAFWAAADVLGGYSGYNYSFNWYPIFPLIYNNTIGLIPYISSRDQGTQASFYMGLATLGLVLSRLDRGIGTALKDTITLFVAPCVVVFELALWSQAPEDMTWHVTDFLWTGGIEDGGIRQNDFQLLPFHNYPAVPGGHFVGTYISGPYVVSNWFVLAVALFLVASRVPWSSLRSSVLLRGKSARLQEGDARIPVARSTMPAKDGGPAGRTISALGAFEPTTLRFLWPE
jgi:hypothetical protein